MEVRLLCTVYNNINMSYTLALAPIPQEDLKDRVLLCGIATDAAIGLTIESQLARLRGRDADKLPIILVHPQYEKELHVIVDHCSMLGQIIIAPIEPVTLQRITDGDLQLTIADRPIVYDKPRGYINAEMLAKLSYDMPKQTFIREDPVYIRDKQQQDRYRRNFHSKGFKKK